MTLEQAQTKAVEKALKVKMLQEELTELSAYVDAVEAGVWEQADEDEKGPLKKQYAAGLNVSIPEDYTMPLVFTKQEVQDEAVKREQELVKQLGEAEKENAEAQTELKIAKEVDKKKQELENDKRYRTNERSEEERERRKVQNETVMTVVKGLFVVVVVLVALKAFKII